ncbi:hypothetical protein F4818DRAFT_375500 [Hypoxylon cercidicola]|nr:hypothetical protein F4818DRAFT_375500 [Hypoxylon cercidicola]
MALAGHAGPRLERHPTTQHRDYPSDPSAPHRSSSEPEPPRWPEINPAAHLRQETESPFQVPGPRKSTNPYKFTGPYATRSTSLVHGINSSSPLPSPQPTGIPASVGPGDEDILSSICRRLQILSLYQTPVTSSATSVSPSHLPKAPERRSHLSSGTQIPITTTVSAPQSLHAELAHWGFSQKAPPNTTALYSHTSTSSTQILTPGPWVVSSDLLRQGWTLNKLHNFLRPYVSLDSLKRIASAQSNFVSKPDNWLQVGLTVILLNDSNQLRYSLDIMAPNKRKIDQFQLQESQDAEMAGSPMILTPAQTGGLLTPSALLGSYAGPVTRSMTQSGLADSPEVVSIKHSSRTLTERLQGSLKKPMQRLKLSNLEEAKDLDFNNGNDGHRRKSIFGGDKDENGNKRMHQPLPSPRVTDSHGNHPFTGQLRVLSRHPAAADEYELASDGSATTSARKRARMGKNVPAGPLRRSPRFLKPLTEFHKYPDLPIELKLMIWEAAVDPRLVYICNRSSSSHNNHPFGVQNRLPPWFTTDKASVRVALSLYKKRFNLIPTAFGTIGRRTLQDVNLDHDIVIFEPCHNGCRAHHCARHQYNEDDRAAVRFLAVQTDSAHLVLGAEPCWESVSRSWPNAETLYLMRVAVKGVDTRDKAMLRVAPNNYEIILQKRFEQWKKGAGADKTVEKLEFVVVVDKESSTTDPKALYQSVGDRKTGLPEDIILG